VKIIVDKEGAQAMNDLLDCAMRQGGIRVLNTVNAIRAGIAMEKPVKWAEDVAVGTVPFPLVAQDETEPTDAPDTEG
jgi:hypothetical protein